MGSAAYDVNRQISSLGRLRSQTYLRAFGDEAIRKDLSPIVHVPQVADADQADASSTEEAPAAAKPQILAFLLLHVTSRADAKQQSDDFAKALTTAAYRARSSREKTGRRRQSIESWEKRTTLRPKAVFQFLHEILRTGETPADEKARQLDRRS